MYVFEWVHAVEICRASSVCTVDAVSTVGTVMTHLSGIFVCFQTLLLPLNENSKETNSVKRDFSMVFGAKMSNSLKADQELCGQSKTAVFAIPAVQLPDNLSRRLFNRFL